MGTHSIVAVETAEGFKGRYGHWDGNPTAMAAKLWAIVKRDGVERARTVLTEENYGWWRIGPGLDDDRVNVPGYGEAFTDSDCGPDDWHTHEHDSVIPWAYVLRDNGITVLMSSDKGWVWVGYVAYDHEPTEAELTALECGAKYERCPHYAWFHVPSLGQNDQRNMREYLKGTR